MAFHHLLEEFQCSGLVAGLGGEGFQDFTLVINGPPQIVLLAVDLHKHLVEVPAPMGIDPHAVNALPSDFSGEHRAKPVPPEAHGFVAEIDPTLGQQILDVPKRQRVFDVHHHDEANYLRRRIETSERARRRSSKFAAHSRWLPLLGTPCHIRLTVPIG